MSQKNAVAVDRISLFHFLQRDLMGLRYVHSRDNTGERFRSLFKVIDCNSNVVLFADLYANAFFHLKPPFGFFVLRIVDKKPSVLTLPFVDSCCHFMLLG